MSSKTLDTPELDRQREIISTGQAAIIQDFLDWLFDEQHWEIGEWVQPTDEPRERLVPVVASRQQIMEQFFKIDPAKIEAERRSVLEALREGG